MAIYHKETETFTDSKGQTTTETVEKEIYKDTEPDYIKIYTAVFFEFKQFPTQYKELFLQLAMRMSYCNSMDFENSQTVYVTGPNKKAIMDACGWSSVSSLTKGLKALCNCGAIRRVNRTVYQINPEFAGRGSWRYNSKLEQGGIKDIIAKFQFARNEVETQIIFDDSESDEDDQVYVAASESDMNVIASMSDDDVEQS